MGAKNVYCQQNLRKFSQAMKLGEIGLQHKKEWGSLTSLIKTGMYPNVSKEQFKSMKFRISLLLQNFFHSERLDAD